MNDRNTKKSLTSFIVRVLSVSRAHVDVGDTKRDGTIRIRLRSSDTMCVVDMVTFVVDALQQRGIDVHNVTDNSVSVIVSSLSLESEVNDDSEGDVSSATRQDRTYCCRGEGGASGSKKRRVRT